MKKVLIKPMIIMLILVYALVGCSADTIQEEDLQDIEVQSQENILEPEIKVFASFYPLYDFAKKVGGDLADVQIMVPDGVDPHSFDPSPRLIAQLEEADVFIYNGLGIEPWIEGVLNILADENVMIVEASEGIELIYFDDHDHSHSHSQDHSHADDEIHNHGEYDPHIWVDPINAIQISESILDAFIEINPENKEVYETNYLSFKEELEKLHEAFEEGLQYANNKKILVSHSAFGYLSKRYGIEEIAVAGVSPHEEPSPGRMAELTNKAREHNLKYIFFEVLANPKTAETIADEANLEVMILYNLEGLTVGQREAGEDYLSLMYKNLENLKKALVE